MTINAGESLRVRGELLADAVRTRGPVKGEALHRLALACATAMARLHLGGASGLGLRPDAIVLDTAGPVYLDWRAPLSAEDLRAQDVRDWAEVVAFAAGGGDLDVLPPALRSVVEECLRPEAAARPSSAHLVRILLGHATAGPVGSVEDLLREAEERVLAPASRPPEPPPDHPEAPWRRPAFYAGVAGGIFLVTMAAVSLTAGGGDREVTPVGIGSRTATFQQRAELARTGDKLTAEGTLSRDRGAPTAYAMRVGCGSRSGQVRLAAGGGSVDGVPFDLERPAAGSCLQQYALHARRNSSPYTIEALLTAAGRKVRVADGGRTLSGRVPLESVRGEETIGAYAGVIATGDVAFELRLDGQGRPERLRLEMTSVNAGPLTSETSYRDWREGR
ncbi:hypothetical protein [Nonomuraea sp. NPDC048826]|uniref:hypothetical protein n=1 Tax=Nonomuraea sp. NPDC048826 TaxID=3364347 RepID=UPI003717B292